MKLETNKIEVQSGKYYKSNYEVSESLYSDETILEQSIINKNQNKMTEPVTEDNLSGKTQDSGTMTYSTPDWVKPESKLSFGEKLCGTKFNPSLDSNVDKIKSLCAELANIVYEYKKSNRSYYTSDDIVYTSIYDTAIGAILHAQMDAVKLVTFKY